MLRGAQTPGELKTRVERLYPYGSIEDVQKTLEALAEHELVERLPRRPGQSQDRYRQLLGGDDSGAPEPQLSTDVESVVPIPSGPRRPGLEEQVAELQRALDALAG